ncbi:MAG: protein kinase [Planctomycetes bacterium]|nr:protein kinase [Planctomycetota bacterium]
MASDNSAFKLIGQSIGGCKIKKLLGTGGMGAVYLANQESLGKEVALKILDERWAAHERHIEGFLREARLAAKLEDEHIIQIYDVGTDRNFNFIVMQFARGENLKDRLKRGPLEIEEALGYIEGVARGISAAHKHGIVHRDIKPGNLVIGDDGIIKILDFGLARLEEGEKDKSQGQFMGSVAYMAPEQSEYMPVDSRTDIYSLGITAYQCFTGTLPFRGENNFDLIVKHHCEEPPAPSVVRHDVPLTLSRVILRMIAKNPGDRYANIDDVLLDLKLMRRHQLPAAPEPWSRRPLNPHPVDLTAIKSEEMYRNALKAQRACFVDNKPVVPMRELMPKMGVVYRASNDPDLVPASFLEVKGGEKRMPLAFAAMKQFELRDVKGDLEYAERFRIFNHAERLVIRVKGQTSLGITEVQRLFDLLEALPAEIRSIAVALEPEYSAMGSDIRWVVDTYNILDKRNCAFTLIVGSMENHTTFVNLGIDSHIKLELELERSASISLERLKPDESGVVSEVGQDSGYVKGSGEPDLTPGAWALVGQIRELLSSNEPVEAARAWRRLAAEGLDRLQLHSLHELKGSIYDALLAIAKETYDADDFESATELFNQLIDLEPGRYEGHYYKGLLLKADGKLEYAQAFLTQAILAAPDEADLFYHRAIVRSRVDDLEGALRDLDMCLTHNPRLVNAYYNRAKLHKRMGRDDLSKRDLVMYERLSGKKATRSIKAPTTRPPTKAAEPE